MTTVTPVKCRAKNPATCKTHGKPLAKVTVKNKSTGKFSPAKKKSQPSVIQEPIKQEAAQKYDSSAFDAFDAAIKKNSAFQRIEAQLFYKNNLVQELREKQLNQDFSIADMRAGLTDYSNPENVAVLKAYNAEYETVSAGWSDEQKEAMNDYTGISNDPVNHYLRDHDGYVDRLSSLNPEVQERVLADMGKLVKDLDSVFESAPVRDEPRTVYRVVQQDLTKSFTSSEEFADRLGVGSVGEVVEFKSFLSTSIDPHFIARWVGKDEENTAVVFVINDRRGVPVDSTATAAHEHIYTQKSEREILLPRDSKFRVTRVARDVGFLEHEHEDRVGRPIAPLTVFLDEVTE